MRKRKWSSEKFGEFNFANICRRFSDEKLNLKPDFVGRLYLCKAKKQYVTGWSFFRESADLTGWCVKQIHFILRGAGEYTINKKTYPVQKGELIYLPRGNFHFRKIGEEPFEYAYICRLPDDFQMMAENKVYLPDSENQ